MAISLSGTNTILVTVTDRQSQSSEGAASNDNYMKLRRVSKGLFDREHTSHKW